MKPDCLSPLSNKLPVRDPFRIVSMPLALCLLALAFTGCKGGDEEADAGEGTDAGQPAQQAEAAPPAPPKPEPVNSVKLVKKWPAGQTVTFSKNVLINRHVLKPTPSTVVDERETTYSITFGGAAGGDAGGADMDGGAAAAPAPASLAQTVDMRIVGQKLEKTANGNKFIAFTGSAAGGGDGGGDESMEEDPSLVAGDAGGGAAPTHPLANSVKASLGSVVKLTFGADGSVTNVAGLSGAGGVHSKVLRGVPRGLYPLVGGMFSQTVFQEAPMFHTLLTGAEVKKDTPWQYSEKGMLLLNWQQDFKFTNTFTGMEDWNGKKVAAFKIAGGISGSTTRPMKVNIAPGGAFTGKALYDPENGILVERTITGSFLATEGANLSVSNAFTQTFKVKSIEMSAGGADMQ